MKRRFSIFWAYMRCYTYLVIYGMWKTQHVYIKYNTYDDQPTIIAAVKGSIIEGNIEIKKIFYSK